MSVSSPAPLPDGLQPRPATIRDLPYPLASDYVKDWTAERAVVELIANALDEDRRATVAWANGFLIIEDAGQGIPRNGLLLGASRKSSQQIGQFGEGKKLAALVLARDPEVDFVQFDTVGYSFNPVLKLSTYLADVPVPDGGTPEDTLVLHYQYWSTDRRIGTRITIGCPEHIAAGAIGRVRHLAVSGYRPPTERAEIILDGEPGRIFIGGILVSQDKRFAASYDLPLSTSKAEQNRDRSIVDGVALEKSIKAALAGSSDPRVLDLFIGRALNGPKLSAAETYFADVTDFSVRLAFREYAESHWDLDEVYHSDTGRAVADELHLQSIGVECITSTLARHLHGRLMSLLGIRPVPQAVVYHDKAYPRIKWLQLKNVSIKRRQTLDHACAVFRSVFGLDSLGKVRVYEEADGATRYCTGAIYNSGSDTVGIKTDTLESLRETLRAVFHEGGHRRAAREGSRYFADRSEDFERALEAMGGQLLEMLMSTEPRRGLPLLDAKAWRGTALPPGTYLADANELSSIRREQPTAAGIRREKALEAAPEPRRMLAQLAQHRMGQVLHERGVSSVQRVLDSAAFNMRSWNVIANPNPAGYRRSGGFTCIPDYTKASALAKVLGIHPPVLYLAHIAVEGPIYNFQRGSESAGKPWRKPLSTYMPRVVKDLRDLGGEYADRADAVREMFEGRVAYDPEGHWLRPVIELVHAELRRLNGGN